MGGIIDPADVVHPARHAALFRAKPVGEATEVAFVDRVEDGKQRVIVGLR